MKPILDDRKLAMSIVGTLGVWAHPMCQPFFARRQRDIQMSEEWFKWFLSDWGVARTTLEAKRVNIRAYLNRKRAREALDIDVNGGSVDRIAAILSSSGWTPRGRSPTSLVSKVAFFVRPSFFIPMDSFSKDGIKKFRVQLGNDRFSGNFSSYEDYLTEFNVYDNLVKKEISQALRENWPRQLGIQYGVTVAALKTAGFRRKVFDNYLMIEGGRGIVV